MISTVEAKTDLKGFLQKFAYYLSKPESPKQ